MNRPQGLPHDLYICNIKRDEELSNRIAERNIPSAYLEPQFSQRPVSTKYALLPIVDRTFSCILMRSFIKPRNSQINQYILGDYHIRI